VGKIKILTIYLPGNSFQNKTAAKTSVNLAKQRFYFYFSKQFSQREFYLMILKIRAAGLQLVFINFEIHSLNIINPDEKPLTKKTL
jgi:hypothetical protein